MVPWAHASLPPKRHLNRFGRFEGSRALYVTTSDVRVLYNHNLHLALTLQANNSNDSNR